MKIKSLVIAATLLATTFYAPLAHANQSPIVESLTFSPTELDVSTSNLTVTIELIVSHPKGLENITTIGYISDSLGNQWGTQLTRIDFPILSSLPKVTYRGSIELPKSISPGIYKVTTSEVKNNSSAGYQYSTGSITATKFRQFTGGENHLFVRSFGDLNYPETTFLGPSYDLSKFYAFKDPKKYNGVNQPIWKINEVFDPSLFFELQVKGVELKISSSTIKTCAAEGGKLVFRAQGTCSFTVYTEKNNDYQKYEYSTNIEISEARIKPVINLSKIETQDSKDLPKIISISQVYLASEGYIFPKSITPVTCIAILYSVKILSGGTCTLTYQSIESGSYLASDVYQQSFEITRNSQTISFSPPATANLSAKTLALSAIASSGGVITYQSTSVDICSITGSTLNLLKSGNCAITATQAGTTTLAPISATATVMIVGSVGPTKKTITCVKGSKIKKVGGTNPKCPKGYKVKR
jgi:hypothetical protein